MENVLFTSSSRFYYLLESFARTYEFRIYSRKFSRLVNTPTKIKFQDVCWFVTEGNRKPSTTARQNFYGRGRGRKVQLKEVAIIVIMFEDSDDIFFSPSYFPRWTHRRQSRLAGLNREGIKIVERKREPLRNTARNRGRRRAIASKLNDNRKQSKHSLCCFSARKLSEGRER